MGSHSTRPQKNTCLLGEVSARHYWNELVEEEKKGGYFDRNRRNTSGTPGETEMTAMVWSPPKVAISPTAATGVEKPATGQEEEA